MAASRGCGGPRLRFALLGILQAVPLLPFLRARGLIASCICQPQGFPDSTALPGIEALGFQLSVINLKKKKERERREEIYSFQPSLAYTADQLRWFLLEQAGGEAKVVEEELYVDAPQSRGSAVDPHVGTLHPALAH